MTQTEFNVYANQKHIFDMLEKIGEFLKNETFIKTTNVIIKIIAIVGETFSIQVFADNSSIRNIIIEKYTKHLAKEYEKTIRSMERIVEGKELSFSKKCHVGCIMKLGFFLNEKQQSFYSLKPFVQVKVSNNEYSLMQCRYSWFDNKVYDSCTKMLMTAFFINQPQWNIIDADTKKIEKIYFPPDIASFAIHEAIGHSLEADIYYNNANIADRFRIGNAIMKRGIDIISQNNGDYLGADEFDDEGTKTKPLILIQDGAVKNIMCDKYYAHLMKKEYCGNCRSSIPFLKNQVRMSNLMVSMSNDCNLYDEEMLNECWIAYEPTLISINPGESFSIKIRYLVNEKTHCYIKDFMYKASIFSFCDSIIGYSKEFGAFTGVCIKNGDAVNVTNGSIGIILKEL